MHYLIGIDTGGTFTDCVVVDEEGHLTAAKSASTPQDFSIGILDSLKLVADSMQMTLADLLKQTTLLCHATTVVTNAIINRSGVKAGLITTRGFEDTILAMRGLGSFAGLSEEEIKHVSSRAKPKPLIPKPLIMGVVERVDSMGEVFIPLSRESAYQAIKYLLDKGVEAIAVALLWSFANPVHEREIRKMINQMNPAIFVSISSEIAPRIGEYERFATTVVNSYVGLVTRTYLSNLRHRLKEKGFAYEPLVVQSYGGCLPLNAASERAVGLICSGPVAGVAGSKFLGELMGYNNIITTDVGGTSFDVGLIYESVPEMAREPTIAQYSLLVPMIAVESIGAGGGSLAWVEPVTNLLKVGPRSAGAVPGAVCYDAGGTEPTVTDADLILGYLNADNFLGGRVKLNKEKAIEAMQNKIADPIGMSVEEAAAGIYDIVNAHMLDLIRRVTVGRGYDPKTCILFAYGGAGPVHASIYGRDARMIVVPSTAAVHSACGALASDIVHLHEFTNVMMVPVDVNRCNRDFERIEKAVVEELRADGFKDEDIIIERYAYFKYLRQTNEVETPVPLGKLSAEDLAKVYDKFEEIYEKLYGKGAAYEEAGIQMVTMRVRGRGRIRRPNIIKHELKSPDSSHALKMKRDAFFRNYGRFVSTDVYDFQKLQAGNIIPGPAIIETPITTIVIHPDQRATLDEYLNIIIKLKEE